MYAFDISWLPQEDIIFFFFTALWFLRYFLTFYVIDFLSVYLYLVAVSSFFFVGKPEIRNVFFFICPPLRMSYMRSHKSIRLACLASLSMFTGALHKYTISTHECMCELKDMSESSNIFASIYLAHWVFNKKNEK